MDDFIKSEYTHHHDNENECDCCNDNCHETMTIITEDGKELVCSVLGIFDVENKEYIAVLPIDSDEVFLYQYIEKSDDDNSFELLNIETDEEFDKISEVFFSIFGEDNFDE